MALIPSEIDSTLKSKINQVLPLALSVILPGLTILVNLGNAPKRSPTFFLNWLIASVMLYLLWHVLWFMWNFNTRQRILGSFISIVIFIGLNYFAWHLNYLEAISPFPWQHLVRVSMGCLLFLTIQYALKTQEHLSQLIIEKEQLQTEHFRVQLQAIRAQIDPHFLFNSLNTLRSMVRQHHDNSEKFIISLADFYRQTLKHNESTMLPLSKELEVLESFLFLMKSRNQAAVSVSIEIDTAFHTYLLPSLALQVVVENCFKHNSMSAKKPLQIHISSSEEGYICISNNIQPKLSESDDSGYGLELLRKRYALMKVEQGLIIQQTPTHFTVSLKLIEK